MGARSRHKQKMINAYDGKPMFCFYCGTFLSRETVTVEHYPIPYRRWKRGGGEINDKIGSIENLQPCCYECNHGTDRLEVALKNIKRYAKVGDNGDKMQKNLSTALDTQVIFWG